MDRLSEMFEMQKGLQNRLGTFEKIAVMGESGRQQFTNQMVLALVEESIEILRETKYKNPEVMPFGWKKGQGYNREKMLGEVVDLWHFMMNLCLAHGFSADDFFQEYKAKNKENYERQEKGY